MKVPPNSLFPYFASASSPLLSNKRDSVEASSKILFELDKGLRSSNLEDQLEALAFFPKLLTKFPLPVIINTSLLKLADFFRNSNNQTRFHILKVFQECEAHFMKILNVDELLRRITSVLHSNDPIARALTLRVLGSLATILETRVDVHQSVKLCFDTHEKIELEASIYAANRICQVSSIFAVSIIDKISVMVEGVELPTQIKLKLIRVFRYMYHDPIIAKKAQEVCEKLLVTFDSLEFVVTLLDTLSFLSIKFLLDLESQIHLLFKYFEEDIRKNVKLCALRNLTKIAKVTANFEENQIQKLLYYTENSPYEDIQILCLKFLTTLIKNPEHASLSIDQIIDFELFQILLLHSNPLISSISAELLVSILKKRDFDPQIDELFHQIFPSLCVKVCHEIVSKKYSPTSFPMSLKCLLEISQFNSNFSKELCNIFLPFLLERDLPIKKILLSWFNQISKKYPQSFIQSTIFQDFLFKQKLINFDLDTTCTLLKIGFYVYSTNQIEITHNFIDTVMEIINRIGCYSEMNYSDNLWELYTIAKSASCNGFHEISHQLFQALSSKVETESFYFWMSSISSLTLAEKILNENSSLKNQLIPSISKMNEALMSIQALSAADSPRIFQKFYIELRIEFLDLSKNLLSFLTILERSSNLNLNYLMKVQALGLKFNELSKKYHFFIHCFFDIDQQSLKILQTMETCCATLIFSIQKFIDERIPNQGHSHIDLKLLSLLRKIELNEDLKSQFTLELVCFQILRDLVTMTSISPGFLANILINILKVRILLPPFFFSSRSPTNIQISTQPTWNGNDPLWVPEENLFVFKIEGIIQLSNANQRKLKNVGVGIYVSEPIKGDCYPNNLNFNAIINDNLIDRMNFVSKTKQEPSSGENNKIKLSQSSAPLFFRIEPKNNYFVCTFLLDIDISNQLSNSKKTPQQSFFSINFHVSGEEENGIEWHLGPDLSIPIQVVRR